MRQAKPCLYSMRSRTTLDVHKFTYYTTLQRVVAWILRFVRNLRAADKTFGELTASELNDSRHQLLQLVQRDTFPNEYDALLHDRPLPASSKIVRFQPFHQHKLIHFGGRLHFADLPHTEKIPFFWTDLTMLHTFVDTTYPHSVTQFRRPSGTIPP